MSLDNFVIIETKLDSSFPSVQFIINTYAVRAGRDQEIMGVD